MAGGIEFTGIDAFNASIDALIAAVDVATRRSVELGSHLIEASAKESFGPAHAKGTPKTVFDRPQSITGSLRRSIQVVTIASPGKGIWMGRTAPTMIYGRRVELGFKGTDSIGRVYNQSGYPYMKPGTEKALPGIQNIFKVAWATATSV